MPIGTVEREMFVEKELQTDPCMCAQPMLHLVETMRAFDIRKVPAGAAENEGGKPFGAEWINQGRPLHRKGTDGRGADVCLEIIDGTFNGEKFERWRLSV